MFNALIIGAGRIAAGFDTPETENVLTHAHAYCLHPDFNLLGFVDPGLKQVQSAAQKWNCRAFSNLSEVQERVDVVSVCSPDHVHYESVLQSQRLNPKLIFLEKPISNNLEKARDLLFLAMPIAVNYSRRYIKEFRDLACRIKNNEFGSFLNGTAYYGKGFIHNGSHMIDLLRLFFGDVSGFSKKSSFKDYFPEDASAEGELLLKNGGRVYFHPINCNHFTMFEVDLLFEKGRLRILNSGLNIEVYKVADDPVFEGYRILQVQEKIKTEFGKALYNAVDNISRFLRYKANLMCTINDGYEAIRYA